MLKLESDPTCPHCGESADGASGIPVLDSPADWEPEGPEVGDYTICCYCLRFAVFEARRNGLQLRKPNDDELATIKADPRLATAFAMVQAIRGAPGVRS